MITFSSFLLRIPVDCHRQKCHPRFPAAMLWCWWHNEADHVGAMACGGGKAGRERIKCACMKGAPRFQPLAAWLLS